MPNIDQIPSKVVSHLDNYFEEHADEIVPANVGWFSIDKRELRIGDGKIGDVTGSSEVGSGVWVLPAGGTWAVLKIDTNTADSHYFFEYLPGGTAITAGTRVAGIAIKVG